MNENKMSHDPNKKNARSISRRALLFALFALPFAAIVEPEPARAQWGDVGSFVGGAMRGMMGGGGYRYHYHGGGHRHSHYGRVEHHRHSRVSVAHRSHGGGGHHYAGAASSPSGPGAGSFH